MVAHGKLLVAHEQFFIDPFNVFLVTLTAFVGLTTALFSRPYMRVEMAHGRLSAGRLRLYHSMYQLFTFTMLLALTTNNIGLLWVAMEGATLSTVLLVTLYRTPASLEAGWKYFILCGVGIAQALFGTILMYFAAEKILGGEGVTALLWTHLNAVKAQLEPRVMSLAFVFLLVGYGTKVGLAPLHNWLPDAHAEGPTPISAVLSGLLLNVAHVCGRALQGAGRRARSHSQLPANMLMGFGLVSVVLASFFLWRQRDIKRLFAYSSVEHMGIITFAFGMGGPVANFAALLHMTVHSLTKSAIFFTVGHAAQKAGSQLMDQIRGLITLSPTDRLGPDAREPRDPRHAALRRVRGRIPDPDHGDEAATLGDADPAAGARRGFCRNIRPRATDGIRRDRRAAIAASAGTAAGICAPRHRADARIVCASVPRGLVPPGGHHDRRALTCRCVCG